jgi:hypothetical protein
MFACKRISHESVSSALAKAERYRLLNEPHEAESICRDVLEVEPGNQQALIYLVLALTDQLGANPRAFTDAIATAASLENDYDRAYYEGLAWERRAKARYQAGGHGVQHTVYDWVLRALHLFEQAESIRPHGNDDAILRWNACVRFLADNRELAPRAAEEYSPIASE